MPVLVQIALGGAIGSVLRVVTSGAASRAFGVGFPWGTFAVNALGSFLIGLVAGLLAGREEGALARVAPFVVPGLLGGFTTFSAFSLETLQLVDRGRPALAAAYAGGSVAAGLAAAAAGVWAGRAWAAA